MFGRELLKEPVFWQVGNGEDILICGDKWIGGKLLPHSTFSAPVSKVSDLINPINFSWDESLVVSLFPEHIVSAILFIPLVTPMDRDALVWPHTFYGTPSIQTAYHVTSPRLCQRKSPQVSFFPPPRSLEVYLGC